MNCPTRCLLCFAIVLLILAAAFVATATANASLDALPVKVFGPGVSWIAQPPPVTFTLTVNIVGTGTVTKNPNLPVYISGTVVLLTANAPSSWQFSAWSGAATGTTNPTAVIMDANKVVTATFALLPTPTPTATASRTATWTATASRTATWTATASRTATETAIATSQPTTEPAATSTTAPGATSTTAATITPLSGGAVATITPLLSGVVATVTPILTPTSNLPSTGEPSLLWMVAGVMLALIVIGARVLRQSSA